MIINLDHNLSMKAYPEKFTKEWSSVKNDFENIVLDNRI